MRYVPLLLRSLFAIAIALTTLSRIDMAIAQAIPKALSEGGSDYAIKQRKNAWTVGVAGGIIDGTYMRFADELGKVLDDGDNLRILPMVSYGAASNLDDLLYLRGVDIAVTQSDVFEYFRTERKTLNLQNRVHYLLRLPIAELHILAKTDIRSLEDLRGKKVNFGPAGSGSSLTGTIVFQRLGVEVEQVLIDQPDCTSKTAIWRSCRSWCASLESQSNFSPEFRRTLGFTLSRSRLRRHLQTSTLWANSRAKTTRRSSRMDRRSIRLQCLRFLPCSTGREEVTDTAALSASPSGFSPIGTSSWSRLGIPSGERSTSGAPYQGGHDTS